MQSTSFLEHTLITGLLIGFHGLLLWIGCGGTARNRHPSREQRRLWAKFVGLMFVVLVVFANAALVLPRGNVRWTAVVAIAFLVVVYIDWRRGVNRMNRVERQWGD